MFTSEIEKYTLRQYMQDREILLQKLVNMGSVRYIMPIMNGAYRLAKFLSEQTDMPLVIYPKGSMLRIDLKWVCIVEDIVDTGKTMNNINERMTEMYRVLALHRTKGVTEDDFSKCYGLYATNELNDKHPYIQFPWEVDIR